MIRRSTGFFEREKARRSAFRTAFVVCRFVLAGTFALVAYCAASHAETIDPCLIGAWEAKAVTFLIRSEPWKGGEGVRVTIQADGTMIIDYSNTQPETLIQRPSEYFTYRGTARARISSTNKIVKIEQIEQSEVTLEMSSGGRLMKGRQPGLGPAALGSTATENAYVCSQNSLEYRASVGLDKRPTHFLKLIRLAGKKKGITGRYPEEGP